MSKINLSEKRRILNKVQKNYDKYNKLKIREGGTFNICSLLRKVNDEVNLHSKFIYELINPNGSHYQGEKFLKLFIIEALEIDDFEFYDLSVLREDLTGDNKRIDFTIESSNYIIGIEMKIDASDGDRQLYDYYKELFSRNSKNKKKKNIRLFYLTKHGSEASEKSIHLLNEKDYTLLSFNIDIEWWLQKCIEEIKIIKLQESINQYKEIVHQITGQLPKELENSMNDIIKNKKDIKTVHQLMQDYPRIWAKKEVDFWDELHFRISNMTIDGKENKNNQNITIMLFGHKNCGRNDYKLDISNDEKINILKEYRHHMHISEFGIKIEVKYQRYTFKIECSKRDDTYSYIDVKMYGSRGGLDSKKNKELVLLLGELDFYDAERGEFLPDLIFYAKDISNPSFDLFEDNKFNEYLTEATRNIKRVLQIIENNKDSLIR